MADHLRNVVANEVDLFPIFLCFLEDLYLAHPALFRPIGLNGEVVFLSKPARTAKLRLIRRWSLPPADEISTTSNHSYP